MFISRMPSSAKPRSTSITSIRSPARDRRQAIVQCRPFHAPVLRASTPRSCTMPGLTRIRDSHAGNENGPPSAGRRRAAQAVDSVRGGRPRRARGRAPVSSALASRTSTISMSKCRSLPAIGWLRSTSTTLMPTFWMVTARGPKLVCSTDLHARLQLLRAEVLLGHALAQAVAALAVGVGRGHVDLEALAGLAAFHRRLQARDDVAVADQDRQRLAVLGALQRLLARLRTRCSGNGRRGLSRSSWQTRWSALRPACGSARRRVPRLRERHEARDGGQPPSCRPRTKAAHYPGSPAHATRRHRALFRAVWRASRASASPLPAGRLRRRPRDGAHDSASAARARLAAVTPADPAAANAVLMRAISLVGTPYRYGGNTPEGGFDCSGLVNYVYRRHAGPAPAAHLARTGRLPGPAGSPRASWPPATWCSSAAAATSPMWGSTSAKGASCMPPAPAARSGWITWTAPTGATTTAARNASCAEKSAESVNSARRL